MKLNKIIFIGAFMLCSACGAKGPLTPSSGNDLPVKAFAQTEEQTAENLLRTSPQARPNREQEILSRSTIRTEDPFDLPPEGDLPYVPENLDPLPEDDSEQPQS